MKSHLLTSRLTVETPLTEVSPLGTVTSGFSPYREGRAVAAQRLRMTGNRTVETGEPLSDYRAEYILHWGHNIPEGSRVRDLETGIPYTVVTVFPDRRNGLVRICCERLND